MRLHDIVISTVVACLLCGCQSQTATKDLASEPAPKRENEFAMALPGEDVEDALIARENRKSDEDAEKERAAQRQEEKLLAAVKSSTDTAASVRALVDLGNFYRSRRQPHDALTTMERAVEIAQKLDKTDPVYSRAVIELGEVQLRMGNYNEALEQFEIAQKVLTPAANEFGESIPRVQERIAWVYRCQGDSRKAEKVLKQAKEGALGLGKDTGDYRVALIEEAVFALDRKDNATAKRLSQEIDSLPTNGGASFGKVFLRIAARNCRKNGELEQEDFLADKSDFFSGMEKRRHHRRRAAARGQED